MSRNPLVNNNNRTREHHRSTSLGKRTAQAASSSSSTTGTIAPTIPALTPAQMYSNFEEWLKACTDNKVNATNTWNFALIDYFHEMTFIKEGDSINFQKASCTLDGCVKIYTSRVDSVATETGKLLSGLADSSNGNDGDDDTRQGGERRTRRKTHKSEATLLKDFSSIALKKFDLDFAVDPLFKKTSADFDEGGARGLLLNHLGIDQYCKIIFDASDAVIECDIEELDGEVHADRQEEEEHEEEQVEAVLRGDDPMALDEEAEIEQEEEEGESVAEKEKDTGAMDIDEQLPVPALESPIKNEENDKESSPVAEEELPAAVVDKEGGAAQESRVEISRLKGKLPTLETLASLNIVPSLKGFDFFTDNDLEIPNLDQQDDDQHFENPTNDDQEPEHNPFQFDDYDVDYGMDDMDPFDFNGNEINENENAPAEEDEAAEAGANLDNTEKDHPEQDFLTDMFSKEKEMYEYFDETLKHNWAGPEHWKMTKAPRPPQTRKQKDTTTGGTEAVKTKRKPKAPKVEFQIAFDGDTDEDEEDLFGTGTKNLKFTAETSSKMTPQLLPEDMHFSSKDLLQYFLKPLPLFSTEPKKKNANNNKESNSSNNANTNVEAPQDNGGSVEADIDYWAGAQDFGDDMMDYGDDNFDMPTDNFDMPTDTFDNNDQTQLTEFEEDTSLYHDNYDDPEVSVLYGDELITNHSLKKSKLLYVNYAKTAKRVDVKKLKDNLWKALTLAKPPSTQQQDQCDTEDDEEGKVYGVQKFTVIVQNLKKMYPPKTMRDISVPFCFICLLHLANEKDLSIMGVENNNEEDDDFVLGESSAAGGDWMRNEAILNEVTIVQNTV